MAAPTTSTPTSKAFELNHALVERIRG